LRFERVDNLGAYRIPPQTGILIPSDYDSYRAPTFRVMEKKSRPAARVVGCWCESRYFAKWDRELPQAFISKLDTGEDSA
jgi:hypothetical protein